MSVQSRGERKVISGSVIQMKGRLKKASQRKGDSMIYAVIRVTAPRQPLPGDAFRNRSIRPFHPDEWTSNIKGQ